MMKITKLFSNNYPDKPTLIYDNLCRLILAIRDLKINQEVTFKKMNKTINDLSDQIKKLEEKSNDSYK